MYELAYMIGDELKGLTHKYEGMHPDREAYETGIRVGLMYCAQMFLQGCKNYEDVIDTIDVIERMKKGAIADAEKGGEKEYVIEHTKGLADAYAEACAIADEIVAENADNLEDFAEE